MTSSIFFLNSKYKTQPMGNTHFTFASFYLVGHIFALYSLYIYHSLAIMSFASSITTNPNVSLHNANSSASFSSSSLYTYLSSTNEIASSSSISNISTFRVFDEENNRFILDLTLQDLDHRQVVIDSFILPPKFSSPLAASWYYISKCSFKLSSWLKPLP